MNPPPAESDLKPTDRTALAEAIDAPFGYVTDTEELTARAGAPGASELGSGIVYAVLALLICETWLARRRVDSGEEGRQPRAHQGGRAHP